MMMLNTRKISVSFVSEALQSTSNEPFLGQGRLHPAFRNIQQQLLRLQVGQIVLGLTLMILSAVAIIEERVLLGLGFGLISSIIVILCSVLGLQNTNPKLLFVVNMIGLFGLLPAFNYTFLNLTSNFWFRFGGDKSPSSSTTINIDSSTWNPSGPFSASDDETSNHTIIFSSNDLLATIVTPNDENRSYTTTSWIVAWLELCHLIPLSASLLYSTYLLKDINYYQCAVPQTTSSTK